MNLYGGRGVACGSEISVYTGRVIKLYTIVVYLVDINRSRWRSEKDYWSTESSQIQTFVVVFERARERHLKSDCVYGVK